MKLGSICCLSTLFLLAASLGGCASHPQDSTSATPRKGHWETLPLETGSYVPRRVWVDENGQAVSSPSMNNLQGGSAADVGRMQRQASGLKSPGN